MSAVIHICTGCRIPGVDPAMHSASIEQFGKMLAERLGEESLVQRYECLGGCHHRGRMSCSSPGKWGWLFGGVDPGKDGADLREFLAKWSESPDGMVPKTQRPKDLRAKILGRLPPFPGQ